jgi:hypothetical protein
MANRRRYDDKFRASAVVMLEAAGYPDRDGALANTSRRLKVPHNTLRNWFHAKRNPPPSELRREKKLDLVQAIKDELIDLFPDMANARQDASYRDMATAAGILIDKLQLLTGEPTERTEHTQSAKSNVRSRVDSIAARIRAANGVGAHRTNGNGSNGATP